MSQLNAGVAEDLRSGADVGVVADLDVALFFVGNDIGPVADPDSRAQLDATAATESRTRRRRKSSRRQSSCSRRRETLHPCRFGCRCQTRRRTVGTTRRATCCRHLRGCCAAGGGQLLGIGNEIDDLRPDADGLGQGEEGGAFVGGFEAHQRRSPIQLVCGLTLKIR